MSFRAGLRRLVLGTLVFVCLLLGAGYVGVSLFTAERRDALSARTGGGSRSRGGTLCRLV